MIFTPHAAASRTLAGSQAGPVWFAHVSRAVRTSHLPGLCVCVLGSKGSFLATWFQDKWPVFTVSLEPRKVGRRRS